MGTALVIAAIRVRAHEGNDGALQREERSRRMNAKRHQISELVGNPGR